MYVIQFNFKKMAQIINASIDLTKISKSKIVEKNGKKWLSLSIVVNDEPDQYGNTVQISENQSQEERSEKAKKNYLGNGKVVWAGASKTSTPAPAPKQETKQNEPWSNDDLPF